DDLNRVADCIANLAERFQRAVHVGCSDVMTAERADIGVEHAAKRPPRLPPAAWKVRDVIERPQLHPGKSFGKKLMRQLTWAFHERDQVFVLAVRIDGAVADSAFRRTTVVWPTAGVVSADAVACRAAEDLPYGHSGRLTENVPQTHVDGRKRAK